MSNPNLSREEARARSEQINVETYEVSIDVTCAKNPDNVTFPVVSTITFTSTAAETWVDFLGETVAAVMLNGTDLDVDYDGSRIRLVGLNTDGPNRVTITAEGRYSRSGQGLHRFVDPADGETYLYTHSEPADARRVYPNFEQPDLKAHFHFTLVGPQGWELLSNQPEASREVVSDDVVMVTFKPTPLLSTYITELAAGPYARFDDHWSGTAGDGTHLEIPLGLFCRQSMAQYLDHENFHTITKQGLGFFNTHYKLAYPWGKYDSIIVPEYNLGAMENPGLVTFTEGYIFRSAATRHQYQMRANTILHEMSHMWFGDLVTPKWWDDLWLKESFAEFAGADSSAEATEFVDAWVAFGGVRKLWASGQDQLPTTHPIVADIKDLEAARQNFDGITYAKGASVLKQLVAYVGRDAFYEGTRQYFEKFQFDSTTLTDLLDVLEETSGRNLGDWSKRWLETAGVDTMRPILEIKDGKIAKLVIEQTSIDTMTGQPAQRPHRLGVGLYHVKNEKLERYAVLDVEVDGGAEVSEAVGMKAPDLVLLNEGDHSYVKVRFDEESLYIAEKYVAQCEDGLTRAIIWSALWDMTRDGELPAAEFAKVVLTQGVDESDATLLTMLINNASLALRAYTPTAIRRDEQACFADDLWLLMHEAKPGSDQQLLWTRLFGHVASALPNQADRLRRVVEGKDKLDSLVISPELRWLYWRSLVVLGAASREEIDAELACDNTLDGITQHVGALAGFPTAEAKAEAWRNVHVPGAMPNDHVDSIIAGFMQGLHADIVDGYADEYFANLLKVWAEHPIEIATRLVRGFYPALVDYTDGDPLAHPRLVQSQAWLDAHTDAPAALRRVVLESQDGLRRALVAQAAAS